MDKLKLLTNISPHNHPIEGRLKKETSSHKRNCEAEETA